MASIISAGTTSGTALNMSADTTGVLQLATGATPTTAVTIDTSQNVGIGTASPLSGVKTTIYQPVTGVGLSVQTQNGNFASQFGNVSGTATYYPCVFYNNGIVNTVGYISCTGSATAYSTSSDYRLKDNVLPMTGALEKVSKLKPVTYKWKLDNTDGEGFIAHELQAIIPNAVTGEKDAVDAEGNPKYQGVDTSFLVATLTAAIQEQQTLIVSQSELINSLTARVTALEAK